MSPKFKLGRDFCTMHLPQVSSSCVYSFRSYRVDKQTNRPRWKHPTLFVTLRRWVIIGGPNALWLTEPKFCVGHGLPGPCCSAPMETLDTPWLKSFVLCLQRDRVERLLNDDNFVDKRWTVTWRTLFNGLAKDARQWCDFFRVVIVQYNTSCEFTRVYVRAVLR